MTENANTYEQMKKTVDEISSKRTEAFLKELEGQIGSLSSISGKAISAVTIDNWLRRAESQAKLDICGLNRVAFQLWSILIAAGATITHQDICQIVPVSDMQERLARAIAERFPIST